MPIRRPKIRIIVEIITFKNVMDKETGAQLVRVDHPARYEGISTFSNTLPDHPGADAKGYVRTPNVNTLIEMADMREASAVTETNLGMIEQARGMLMRVVDVCGKRCGKASQVAGL